MDGAHTLGQASVDLGSLGAAYFVSNCHKWLCGPKASAVLYVRPDKQEGMEPAIISHGSGADHSGRRGSFQDRFAWQGTFDPTPAICAGSAATFLSSLMPGGLDELMQRNHAMAIAFRRLLGEAWAIPHHCPDEMIGSMVTLPIAQGYPEHDESEASQRQQQFMCDLRFKHHIECQPRCFGDPLKLHIRLSCHAYNSGDQLLTVLDFVDADYSIN